MVVYSIHWIYILPPNSRSSSSAMFAAKEGIAQRLMPVPDLKALLCLAFPRSRTDRCDGCNRKMLCRKTSRSSMPYLRRPWAALRPSGNAPIHLVSPYIEYRIYTNLVSPLLIGEIYSCDTEPRLIVIPLSTYLRLTRFQHSKPSSHRPVSSPVLSRSPPDLSGFVAPGTQL